MLFRTSKSVVVLVPIFAGLLLTGSSAKAQSLIYVDDDATGANNGTSWVDAFADLQSALDAAEASGGAVAEIWVAGGTYCPSKRTDPSDPRSATFHLVNGVSVYGGFAGAETLRDERDVESHPTVLSGDLNHDDEPGFINYTDNVYHVLKGDNLTPLTILDGLTVSGGHAPGIGFLDSYGAGLFLLNAFPVIRNCTFSHNLAERPLSNVAWSGGGGAALFFRVEWGKPDSPMLAVSHSRFKENESHGDGNAVFAWGYYGSGSLIFSDCVFERNTGQGAFNAYDGGKHVFRSCTFSENSSSAILSDSVDEVLVEQCRFERNMGPQGGVWVNNGGQVTIRDSVFIGNGGTTGLGGGLRVSGALLFQMIDSQFQDNSSGSGGAAFIRSDSPATLLRCEFSGNSATQNNGGGLVVHAAAILDDCSFLGNRAESGGGGLYVGGVVTLKRGLFKNNYAQDRGGAIFVGSSEPIRIETTQFRDNYANSGGAVAMVDSAAEVKLVGSLIVNNHASSYGGGIAGAARPLRLSSCTIASNTVGVLGGGLLAGRESTVRNCVFWGNVEDPYGHAWVDEAAQIGQIQFAVIDSSNVQGWTGTYGGEGNMGIDPLFVQAIDPDGPYEPGEPDYRLQPDSPCINAGDPDYVSPPGDADLDAHTRVLCGRLDIGAYEFGIGDFDCNQAVDLADFAGWSACMTGPDASAIAPGCEAFDFNADADVDLHDLAALQRCFTSEELVATDTVGIVTPMGSAAAVGGVDPCCRLFDLDEDDRITIADLPPLERILRGP